MSEDVTCRMCGVDKPADAYTPSRLLERHCKDCRNAQRRDYEERKKTGAPVRSWALAVPADFSRVDAEARSSHLRDEQLAKRYGVGGTTIRKWRARVREQALLVASAHSDKRMSDQDAEPDIIRPMGRTPHLSPNDRELYAIALRALSGSPTVSQGADECEFS